MKSEPDGKQKDRVGSAGGGVRGLDENASS